MSRLVEFYAWPVEGDTVCPKHTPPGLGDLPSGEARLTLLLVAAARPGVLPVFDPADHFWSFGELKPTRPAHEPSEWMKRISPRDLDYQQETSP